VRVLRLCLRVDSLIACLLLVFCWGCTASSARRDELLTAMRIGKSPEARQEALLELRDYARPWMRQDFEAVLAYELDPTTRALAAQVLGELGDLAAADALRASARRDSVWVVRRRALVALTELLGSHASDDLEYVLQTERQPEVVVTALELAHEHMAEEDLAGLTDLLLAALAHRSPAVRLRAGTLLHDLTGLSAAPRPDAWRRALKVQ
jgi:hypothetical protein